MTQNQTENYAGFWIRCGGALIDVVLFWIITTHVMLLVYGRMYFEYDGLAPLGIWDFVVTWILPLVGCTAFWIARSATPGKLVLGMRIIDARTGGKPSNGQFVRRILGSLVSASALGLGYLWAGIDARKQTWHDKMAGTVVVRGVV